MNFDQINNQFLIKQKQSDTFYEPIMHSVYKTIQDHVEKGQKGAFYELPLFRFGEPLGNPIRMTQKIQEKLANEKIRVELIGDGPYIFLSWQETMEYRARFGCSPNVQLNGDQMVDKYKDKVQQYLKDKKKK